MVVCILQESIQPDFKMAEDGEHEDMIELRVEIKEAEELDHGTLVQEVEVVMEPKELEEKEEDHGMELRWIIACLLYTSPSPRDGLLSRMPSSA